MRLQKRYILSLGLLFFVFGMSRPLQYKRATGKRAQTPKGVTVTDTPVGYLGENTNNQGCWSTQKLDVIVKYKLVNQSKKALSVDSRKAHVIHNKKSYIIEAISYTPSDGKTVYPSKKAVVVAPGMSGTFTMSLRGFLSKKHLKTTKQLQLVVPTSNGTLQFGFDNMDTLKILTGRPGLR